MILKLTGRFSYIDKYDRLQFVWINDNSEEKLFRAINTEYTPITNEGFVVHLEPQFKRNIPVDIKLMLGYDCTIHVTLHKYKFRSKFEFNYNQNIVGQKLTLKSIELAG